MNDYLDVKIDVFEHTGQRARVRKSLTINALIDEVLREFDDIAGDTPEKYAIYLKGFDNPLKVHETLTELDIQPQDELVFGYMRQVIRRMLDIEQYATLREESTGKEFAIQWHPAVIGRPSTEVDHNFILAVNVQLLPNGITVSRRHAQITFSEGRYFVEPLAEQNPVFLNGKELPFQARREIRNGDRLAFGNKKLTMTFFTSAGNISHSTSKKPLHQETVEPALTTQSPIFSQPPVTPAIDEERTMLSSHAVAVDLIIEASSISEKVGQHIEVLTFPFTVGRLLTELSAENEVSHRHAEFNYDAERGLYTITDLHSTTGVTIYGLKIVPGVPHVISSGTRIGLGSVLKLRFELIHIENAGENILNQKNNVMD